jgi:membrane-bound ClpP family serine protease
VRLWQIPSAFELTLFVEKQLDHFASEIEKERGADVMAIVGPIFAGLDNAVRDVLERRKEKSGLRRSLLIVLDTAGGIIEVVERMVNTIRHHYEDVTMVIPSRAMSAGTVFAMSGDRIMMDYFSDGDNGDTQLWPLQPDQPGCTGSAETVLSAVLDDPDC